MKNYSKLKCKEKFQTLQHLESHIDVVHLKEKFHCDFCDLSFSLKASLEIHENIVHFKKEPLKCEYCDLTILIQSNLTLHSAVSECRFLKSAEIPPLPSEEEDQTFDGNSGIIVDPLSELSKQETYGQV